MSDWIHTRYLVERTECSFGDWLTKTPNLVMTTESVPNGIEIDIFGPMRGHPGCLGIEGRLVGATAEDRAALADEFEACYQKPIGPEEIERLVKFVDHAQQYG